MRKTSLDVYAFTFESLLLIIYDGRGTFAWNN